MKKRELQPKGRAQWLRPVFRISLEEGLLEGGIRIEKRSITRINRITIFKMNWAKKLDLIHSREIYPSINSK